MRSPAAAVVMMLFLPGIVRADFNLPIAHQVYKILSVPDDFDLAALKRFADIRDLTLELRMSRGNLIPEWLISALKESFKDVTIRVVLSGDIRRAHVDSLRRIEKMEVLYQVGRRGINRATLNSLHALGPVPKVMVIPADFDRKLIEAILKLKQLTLVIEAAGKPISEEQLDWLAKIRHTRKVFSLGPDHPAENLYSLSALNNLELWVRTEANRISQPMMNVLKDMRKVAVTLSVNGRLTIEDAKCFSRLERFLVRVELSTPADATPGLVGVLNQIAPPQVPQRARNP